MDKEVIAIIGGGASGLMAAYSAGKAVKEQGKEIRIIILEASDRVGKKLLATGNGRCNLSNTDISRENYYRWNSAFWERVNEGFPWQDTIKEFEDIGILTKRDDTGRIYPMSEQASTLLDALRMACYELGVEEITESRVHNIEKINESYKLHFGDSFIVAQKVIYAAGGCAGQNFGTDGSSFELLKKLGIKVSELAPSLVPLKTSFAHRKELKGVRVKAKATIFDNGAKLKTESGEVQFTEYGLSGIVIMNLSRYRTSNCKIALDLATGLSQEFIKAHILQKKEKFPTLFAQDILNGILPKKLGNVVVKMVTENKPAKALSACEAEKISGIVKSMEFKIVGAMPFENAQVTSGGVLVFQLDEQTLEVKGCRNFYVVGEAVDIDGCCGGYNLQWAWTSGFLAGKAAGRCI